ncbi:hypothetical protein BUALT_Bualt06G0092000 [Buddleja alternifolia]|uniref:Diacylglycerol O-acyltransferase n=1 Tax=Buddleja alternifolia TaxID=168488 RepID=A0AAV6XPP7_9LAMI|nr:hypothetical protein BUALT_Bualt06G0092000 [Buddleja alternifolia]
MKMSVEEEPASPAARVLQAPNFSLCIIATMGFMTTIDVNVFRKGVEQTLIKHPRFSSLLVVNDKKRGKVSWKRTKVDVENHVLAPDLDPDMENPEEFVEDYTSSLSAIPMDMTKPLWEIHILNVKTKEANSTMVYKIHHSLGDGVSMVSVIMACAKKTSDPESLPVIPSRKQKHVPKYGLMKRFFLCVWTMMLIMFNTFTGIAYLAATLLFLKDSETPLKGGRGVRLSPKRFVHRIINLDDVKMVKNAMNVSINDVVLGMTEAGINRHLNRRYEKLRGKGSEIINKTNFLPRNLRLRSAVIFNLRQSASVEDLAEMMKKEELNGMWGNLLGIVILPFTIALQDDPLTYIHRAKATMDRKKLSLESKLGFIVMKLFLKLFGIKAATAATKAAFAHTTLAFSNVVGPQEEISLFGHPLCYISPSVQGFPQALTIHYQSYANKLIVTLGADEKTIPNPHQLCDDFVKSFESIKEAVIKRGLIKDIQFC